MIFFLAEVIATTPGRSQAFGAGMDPVPLDSNVELKRLIHGFASP